MKNSRTLLPDVIGPGGVCDAYQPVEKEAENTKRILKILARHHFPVNISTKSSLILRDLDILTQIAEDTWCTVGFSITTTDNQLASFLEPYSFSPQERLRALKEIKQNSPQIQVGTNFMPIIPFLEDSLENIENVIRESKRAGADFVLFAPGVTLRDQQGKFFFQKLRKSSYKNLIDPLRKLYNGKIYPPPSYVKKIHQNLYNMCQKHQIAMRVKRWIPRDYRKWNYKISEILLNKEYFASLNGNPNNNMRWAGLNLNNLKESIIDVYRRGELAELKNFNNEIINMVEPYLKESKEYQKRGLDRFL
mgnify:FL=1